jgi:hypothetical protein
MRYETAKPAGIIPIALLVWPSTKLAVIVWGPHDRPDIVPVEAPLPFSVPLPGDPQVIEYV